MSFEEQIHVMSKDKYPSIFLLQVEVVVFIILPTFFTARIVFEIVKYHWYIPQFYPYL